MRCDGEISIRRRLPRVKGELLHDSKRKGAPPKAEWNRGDRRLCAFGAGVFFYSVGVQSNEAY